MEYFYQDFLFADVPLTSNEMPSVELNVIRADEIPLPIEGPFPVEESYSLKLSGLLQIVIKEEWTELLEKCTYYSTVYLIDDVPVVNENMLVFKEFFIKTYYWHLSNHCHKVLLVIL